MPGLFSFEPETRKNGPGTFFCTFFLLPISTNAADSRLYLPSVVQQHDPVPPKIRELIAELERAGFENRGGKGSHRHYVHPGLSKPVTISGKLGDDAKRYQVRAVRRALLELEK